MGETRTELSGDFPFLVGLLSSSECEALANHRGRTDWETADAGENGEQRWLRIPSHDEEIFAYLPLLGRWRADASLRLFKEGHRVPENDLQSLNWEPLAKVLTLLPPPLNAPAIPPFPIGFGLVRNDDFQEPTALLCSWDSLAEWCDRALAPRIECLRFALSSEGTAIVAGAPLPAIQGASFYRNGDLWVPTGFKLPDFTWPELVEEALDLQDGETALILENGDFDVIASAHWINATRATIRLNAKDSQEEGSL
ncbi:MAG: hypothetical protein P1U86_11980 [Verrucomicrobiales bacterium]|nr:hypothetical protein [Verrucomicrobiales bacterium]